jgi:hypothetical protein
VAGSEFHVYSSIISFLVCLANRVRKIHIYVVALLWNVAVQMPIESNPDVINEYAAKMGFPTEQYKCYDLLSTEDWALDMIPRPVIAVMMLFPIKAAVRCDRVLLAQ